MLRRYSDFLFPFHFESSPLEDGTILSRSKKSHLHANRILERGWYIVELMVSGVRHYEAMLSFGGDSSKSAITLIGKSKGITKRIFYLPEKSDNLSLCFDNVDDASIDHLTIKPISKRFALKRMLKKVCANRSYAKNKTNNELWNYLDRDLARLVEDYENCFGLKGSTIANYEDWLRVEKNEEKTAIQKSGPLISIVIPIYKPDMQYLQQAIDSIKCQTYQNIEICVADDASKSDVLYSYLNHCALSNRNFRYVIREVNGHISAATNSALELVKGNYIVFMDQDDLLAPHALNEIAATIEKNPDLSLIYSDEDKVDESNRRFEGHFKPDFSRNLLLGHNYISHLTCMKTSLVRELGGLRLGFEGAQDHDLLLRALPYLNTENVRHIPKVLYHWRAIQGSTALSLDEKSYAEVAAEKAVRSYIENNEVNAVVTRGRVPNTLKLKWPIIDKPLVSLLIPTRDGLEVLKPCIESILSKTLYSNYEILILDNDSERKETLAYFDALIKKDSRVKVIKTPGEFNYSNINNIGVSYASGGLVALVNNDIEVIEGDWLGEMISLAIRKEIGCVGAKLLYPDGRIQHGGVILGIGGVAGHSHLYKDGSDSGYFQKMDLVHEVSAVTAACLVVRKDVYLEVGGLDDSLKVAFNDVDFCLKVRKAGYTNLFTPFATLYHHESISRGYEDTPEKQKRFNHEVEIMQGRWEGALTSDPFYNSNFNLMAEPYHLNSQ